MWATAHGKCDWREFERMARVRGWTGSCRILGGRKNPRPAFMRPGRGTGPPLRGAGASAAQGDCVAAQRQGIQTILSFCFRSRYIAVIARDLAAFDCRTAFSSPGRTRRRHIDMWPDPVQSACMPHQCKRSMAGRREGYTPLRLSRSQVRLYANGQWWATTTEAKRSRILSAAKRGLTGP